MTRHSARAALSSLLLQHSQPFTSPDPLNPFVVHTPARIVQQPGDHPISVTSILVSQFDDIIDQLLFIGMASRCLALRRSMLTKCAAGAALGHAQFLPHMGDTFSAT